MKTGIRVGGPATGGRNQFEFTLDLAERPGPEPEPKPTRRASHAERRGLADARVDVTARPTPLSPEQLGASRHHHVSASALHVHGPEREADDEPDHPFG